MLTHYQYWCFLLFIISFSAASQSLKATTNIDFDQAEFYLLDVSDNGEKVTPSIDSYIIEDELFIAITPLFEGLRLNYSLIGNKLSVTFANQTSEFEFEQQQSDNGEWFNDGSFIFIKASILEQLFATKITINTTSLTLDLSGHRAVFPYKTIKNQQKQRKMNNFIIERSDADQQKSSGAIITIEDEYRLATVPTGYASLEYQVNDRTENYDATLQMVSDLAYHSASITLVKNDLDTSSRVLLSRYPKFAGDKILGIWDTYSVGDLYLTQSSLTPGSSSRGLGISFAANQKGNFNENMKTSFSKVARPGWDADIYHNGVFLETRVVPDDGLMEFNDLEVFYGDNEFKIVLYGPFGEQETLIEQVNVRNNSLGQGDISYGLSIKENNSSLLDINPSEFDIDAISGNFSIGLFKNWQIGLAVDLNGIHNPDGRTETYRVSNQITFPGWFIQNNIAVNPNNVSQATSLATSFFNNDNFTLRYDSKWDNDSNETQIDESILYANYHIRIGATSNNISYSREEFGLAKAERLQHQFSFYNKYVNVSNSLSYIRRNNDTDDRFFGALNLTTALNRTLRLVASIPYEISGEEVVDPEQISASVLYNYINGAYYHTFSASNRSFFNKDLWSIGYNMAVNKPTHQFTFRSQYNSDDKWSLTAGIAVNFGYDYFNNEMVFSNQTLRGAGSLDVHTYLDRQLNGIPDVLDYNLAGVTFSGGPYWEEVATNQDGRARLFGAKEGVTALSANWQSGGATLNNDYVIYSHPGSLQRVNLPFYLTTEVELFVILANGEQAITLANVPLIASNLSTGDEYTLETDFDGYASFSDLLPGKYNIYVDKTYLHEKGLQAEIGGFEFESPLRGGYVLLPNIVLSRSESGAVGTNKFQKVLLDENNYEPLLNTDNDKLIHLPPKGGMKAPYSSDKLERGVFKEIRMQSTEQERRELRRKLTTAAESSQQFLPDLNLSAGADFDIVPDSNTVTSNDATINALNTDLELSEDLDAETVPTSDSFSASPEVLSLTSNNLSGQNTIIEESTRKLSSGFVAQFAAFKSLDVATSMAQNFLNINQLHIVRKLVNGETMYCLISQVFEDAESAREYLRGVNQNGFIVDSTQYLEPVWSKQ